LNNNTNNPSPCGFLRFDGLLCLTAGLTLLLAGCATPLPPQTGIERPRSSLPPLPGAATAPPQQPPATATAPVATPQAESTGAPSSPAQAESAANDKAALLRAWIDQQARLYRVAAPLLINNTELCPRHARNLLGFTAKNRYSYSAAFADTAQSELALEERLRVMNVLPGSGAEQAGLQKGDILLAVEIEPLPQGPDAENASASVIASELQGREHVNLAVLRNGERKSLDIPLTSACAMVIDLGNAGFAGSFADGQRIMVTQGMLNRLPSDDELAYVLAQEIARNVLAEHSMPEAAALIDRLHTLAPQAADDTTAAGVTPVEPDAGLRARKLALFLLARAGYAIDGAPAFWQTLGNPAVTDAELSALTEVIGTIKSRQQLGLPLVPDQS